MSDVRGLTFAGSPLDALAGVDALLVLTEWKCFHNPDFDAMARCMRGRVIFDGRNLYDPALMDTLGFVYQGIGRRGQRQPDRVTAEESPLATSRERSVERALSLSAP